MRSILKPLAGGALALMLVLSASPAQAFGEQSGEPDPATAVETPSVGEPQTSTPEDETSTEESPTDGAPDEATDPAVEPEAEAPAAEETEAAPEAPAEPVIEAPEAVQVTGTLLVLPDESSTLPLDPETGESTVASEPVGERLVVATNEFGFVSLDAGASEGALVNGADFVGSVELPAAAVEAVQGRIDDEGKLEAVEVAETAHEAAAKAGVEVAAVGSATANPENADAGMGIDAPTEAVIAAKSHPVDVVNFGGSARTAPTKAGLQKLVADVSTYWKSQTNGKVSGMTFSTYKTLTPNVSRCDESGLWTQAIWSYKNSNGTLKWPNANDYLKSGRHLLAVVNQKCGGAAGWGTIPTSIHSGGVIWVDLGVLGSGQPTSDGTVLTAHEFGHNLGLGHGDARVCTSPKVDSATSGGKGSPVSGSGCSDSGYGDQWNLMGSWYNGYGKKPVALPIGQKKMLGVSPSGSYKQVSTSGGSVQNFTINAAGLSSGLRGLRVTGPGSAGSVYVEYRNKSGQDSGAPWTGSYLGAGSSYPGYVATGVRVMRSYDASPTDGGKRNVALSRWSGSNRLQTLQTGSVLQPYGGTMQIRVTSISGDKANVRVEYKGFRPGGKSVSTSISPAGSLIAGKTLVANTSGSWSLNSGFGSTTAPTGTVTNYQWYREGKAISGATKSSYKTTTADINKRITVKVYPTKTGYVKGSGTTSAARLVSSPPFIDVLYGRKFYTEIAWMKYSGISTGTSTSAGPKYEPSVAVSREAMAAFLYRRAGSPAFTAPAKSPFADVKTTHKFYKQIAWMRAKGISTGTVRDGKRYYEPSKSVSREAMAAFIYRLYPRNYTAPATSRFVDVKRSDTFYKEISWMRDSGLSTGTVRDGKRYYDPKKSVSREAMAAFLYRLAH